MSKPILSVAVITYNHGKYIVECLESIVSQEVSYPYEIVIGEDCSTDDTMMYVEKYAEKYPELIKVITSEQNVGAIQNDLRVLSACRGKYLAFCEGDDYWLDKHKLQKQIDFLEQNPDYGMVHTNFLLQNKNRTQPGNTKGIFRRKLERPSGNILESIVKNNQVGTASVCVRSQPIWDSKVKDTIIEHNWGMSDYPFWLELAGVSKIKYMPDITSVYRIHQTSLTHGLNWEGRYNFFKNRFAIKRYYAEKFNVQSAVPYIEGLYHKELLKFAIFMKNKKMREACIAHYQKTGEAGLHLLFAKYPVLDGLFKMVYRLHDFLNISS